MNADQFSPAMLVKTAISKFEVSVQQDQMRERVASFGPHIKNNRHLKQIIAKIPIEQRLAVYKALIPHLNFKPLSFISIKPR